MRSEITEMVVTSHLNNDLISIFKQKIVETLLIFIFFPVKPSRLSCLINMVQQDELVVVVIGIFECILKPIELVLFKVVVDFTVLVQPIAIVVTQSINTEHIQIVSDLHFVVTTFIIGFRDF